MLMVPSGGINMVSLSDRKGHEQRKGSKMNLDYTHNSELIPGEKVEAVGEGWHGREVDKGVYPKTGDILTVITWCLASDTFGIEWVIDNYSRRVKRVVSSAPNSQASGPATMDYTPIVSLLDGNKVVAVGEGWTGKGLPKMGDTLTFVGATGAVSDANGTRFYPNDEEHRVRLVDEACPATRLTVGSENTRLPEMPPLSQGPSIEITYLVYINKNSLRTKETTYHVDAAGAAKAVKNLLSDGFAKEAIVVVYRVDAEIDFTVETNVVLQTGI